MQYINSFIVMYTECMHISHTYKQPTSYKSINSIFSETSDHFQRAAQLCIPQIELFSKYQVDINAVGTNKRNVFKYAVFIK
jgi:hypothetical protein